MAVTTNHAPRPRWYRPGSGWLTEQLVPLETWPRWGLYAVMAFGTLLMVPVVVAPLGLLQQVVFGVVLFGAALVANRWKSSAVTMVLSVLSVVVSSRYIYWRATETLHFDSWAGALFGVGLLIAELYAWTILVLGYFQTAAPLERPAEPLPDDMSLWPTVDVYVPTYNESLDIVADTILAALNLDYPAEKLRVHVLDDGRREEFRAFAAKVGANYIIRPDNAHAKAGNLNHALTLTDGELVAVFDADHVSTRGFLQVTVGGFLTDPKLALVQTPHHFYSPDPFERNIRGGNAVPNEGELFYGPVQKGNDLWNAAFFCGSCAVIRRAALDDVGGFAVETVTEDAHTALRMQKRGWNTAYLGVALAAGRATERLALHVGQRVRWARGMTQILRLENPLFGGKLSLAQRLCYLNAMVHFQFALPRIVFLIAPIAFLLFGESIIASTAPMVLAYAGPHLLLAAMTAGRVHGPYRLTFWGELYETALSFHLAWPVLAALVNPKLGKFNVTEKGGLLEHSYFDFRIARFHLLTLLVVFAALCIGCYRLLYQWEDADLRAVLLLNVTWALYNTLILMGSIAAAFETRQIRRYVRMPINLPATIFTASGHTVCAGTVNLSIGGAMIKIPDGVEIDAEDIEALELPVADRTEVFPVTGIAAEAGFLRLSFEEMPVSLYRQLVGVVFGRADAWVERAPRPPDRTSRALVALLRATSGLFFRRRLKAVARPATVQPDLPAVAMESHALVPGAERAPDMLGAVASPAAKGGVAALVLAMAAIFGLGGGTTPAQAQTMPQPPAQAGAPLPLPTPPGLDAGPDATPPVAPPPGATPPPPGLPGLPELPPVLSPVATPSAMPGTRTATISLKDLGAQEPLRLIGVESEIGFPLDIRQDEVVTGAKFVVDLAYSPSLLPELSHMSALVNGVVVGTVPLQPQNAGGLKVEIPVNPAMFVRHNRVGVRVIAHYTTDCEDPVHSSLWAIVNNATALELTLQTLPPATDLAALPAPFFDTAERKPLRLPFALPANPSSGMLRAAGVAAGYFAMESGYRGADFPVETGSFGAGDHVVLATPQALPRGITLPTISGPTIANIANGAGGRLLLIAGRNDEELHAAATTLALGSVALSGSSMTVGTPSIRPRAPYDAPRWLPDDRPVRFGELVEPDTLQGFGLIPGPLTVPFRTSPDLFVWSDRGLPMVVRYRYPRGEWLDLERSRLDVSINGRYLKSLPVEAPDMIDEVRDMVGDDFVLNEGQVKVPPFDIGGRNQIDLFYDLRPKKRGACQDVLPTHVTSSIDPDSTIDISNVDRFAVMPNLGFFASAGFPFTVHADLGRTAVVLPSRPTAPEIQAFLGLMGRFSEFTGFPPLAVTIVQGTGDVTALQGRDVLVIGTLGDRLDLDYIGGDGPLVFQGNRMALAAGRSIDRAYALLDGDGWTDERERVGELLMAGTGFAGIIGEQARGGTEDRSVVMVVASDGERLPTLVRALSDSDINAAVQGDLAVFDGASVQSFRIGPTYTVGELGFYGEMRWYFRNKPLLLAVVTLLAVALIGIVFYTFLRLITKARLRRKAGA